jgi:preprotein translocase subunit SecA
MIGDLLKKIFGDKNAKDKKLYWPYAEQTLAELEKVKSFSDQGLRDKTREFQMRIRAEKQTLEDELSGLRTKAEDVNTPIEEKENLFDKIDKLEKTIVEQIEITLAAILPEAFAVVEETAFRWSTNKKLEVIAEDFDRDLSIKKDGITIDKDKAIWHSEWTAAGTKINWNMIHYDVQLMGGAVLHKGNIAEMQTGEGKTLVATLPVYLNALAGKGVHIVTVNDYLAKRDSEWMGPLYQFHGLSVDCIDKHRPNSPERRTAYLADITFGTNNEFGFDYLRDNMVSDLSECAQRKLNFAIVDEVDSILIDEARTPLIISQSAGKSTERYQLFAKLARKLTKDEHYSVDEKQKAVSLNPKGITKIEQELGVENVYDAENIEDVHHIEQSLKAEALFVRDKDYVVSEGEIVIVDEFTGRLLAGRRYSEGLHQVSESACCFKSGLLCDTK